MPTRETHMVYDHAITEVMYAISLCKAQLKAVNNSHVCSRVAAI